MIMKIIEYTKDFKNEKFDLFTIDNLCGIVIIRKTAVGVFGKSRSQYTL